MTQLKLQKRDDPLAISPPDTLTDQPAPASPTDDAPQAGRRPRPAGPPTSRRRATPQPAPTEDSEVPVQTPPGRVYDEDRLEQTGWRIYESLLEDVRIRAEELTAAGIPTSAAALAAATLHSYLPRTVEDGSDVMRVFRQASAGRRRTRTAS
jgi:hypothetical protein